MKIATIPTLATIRSMPTTCCLFSLSLYRMKKSRAVVKLLMVLKELMTAGLIPISLQKYVVSETFIGIISAAIALKSTMRHVKSLRDPSAVKKTELDLFQ